MTLLSKSDIRSKLSLTERELNGLINRSEIPHIRLGRRQVKFELDKVTAWLKERIVPYAPKQRVKKVKARQVDLEL